MATAYTSLLGLALPVTGELQGTWGTTVNDAITSLLDTAVAGTTTLNTDADVTLSTTTGSANQARQAIILWTANGTVTRNITAPAHSKSYIVINATAGTQSIVIRGVGPTTGVTITAGTKVFVVWNGSDFVRVASSEYPGAGIAVSTGSGWTTSLTAPSGTIVGTTDSQTLTNKTISADNNTINGIAASSFVLSNASGVIDGAAAQKAIPTGDVVGTSDSQTLTNKTISADNNTINGIAASSFVLSNASGNIDGAAAQKIIPSGDVVGTTDSQNLSNKVLVTPTVLASTTTAEDGIVINGRAGGSSSYRVTIAPTTLSASRALTLPDNSGTVLTTGATVTVPEGGTGATTLAANNVLLGNGTSALQVVAPGAAGNVLTSDGTTWGSVAGIGISSNNNFTGANTFYNSTGQTFGTATSTNDGFIIGGRAGGIDTYRITFAPGILSASRTATFPDATGTVLIDSASQTVTNKTISADSNTLSGIAASSFVLSDASGNIDGFAAQKAIPTGVVVGTTDSQTLTNKTISADNNTLSGIAASSFVLSNASGNIDGAAAQKAIPSGVVVGDSDTQTLTNKTISADNNTLSGIAASSFVLSNASGNIDGAAAQKAIPTGVVVGDTDTQTLTNKTLTDPAIVGTILEDVYTIVDGAAFEVDPGNGSIQLITLGASRTPKATNFAAGEAITLMVDDGSAYTITWTDATWGGSGVVWMTGGGTAPILNTTGYTTIVLWKVSTQVYGAKVG